VIGNLEVMGGGREGATRLPGLSWEKEGRGRIFECVRIRGKRASCGLIIAR